MSTTTYAGFWLRFVAYVIDACLIYAVQAILILPLLGVMGMNFISNPEAMQNMSESEALGAISTFIATMSATSMVFAILVILYYTLMESSKYQATVGKLVLGIKVTDVNGAKLDFVKALIRNLCKIISSLIMLIGYIMAGFTEKKQALHDLIAGTLVVKK